MLYEIIALIALTLSTGWDLYKREVPDTLSYGLIGIAFLLRIIFSFTNFTFQPILEGILGFTVFFGIGYILYKLNQWGGADAKLLGGLGALFGLTFNLDHFMIGFLINLFLVGGIYGLIYSLILIFMHRKKLPQYNKTYFRINTTIFILLFLLGLFIINTSYEKILFLSTIAIFYLLIVLWPYINYIQKNLFEKYITPPRLTEGDWVAQDIKNVCKRKDNGLTKKQIEKLNKLYHKGKISKVKIKEGIPFIPSFLLALIVSLIWGNLFFVVNHLLNI